MKPTSLLPVVLFGLLLSAAVTATVAEGQETLVLCLAEAADYSPVYATQTFPAPTTGPVVVFRVPKGKYQKLTIRWKALDPGRPSGGGDVELPRFADRGGATLAALPVGKYRLEVAADGNPWKSMDFTVAETATMKVARPEDLAPISRGKVWTYAFVQEGGEGGTGWKKPLGLTPDAQGKLRGTFTFTAGNADKTGWAVDVRVNNRPTGQVWWRVNDSGFAVTQSLGEYKELTVFEPPAVLLPWPLKAPQTWSYGPPEKRAKSTYQMWGPVPVTGPKGEAPGYVVVTEEQTGNFIKTTERHFLPGVGLVREVIIVATNERVMQNSMTWVLKEVR